MLQRQALGLASAALTREKDMDVKKKSEESALICVALFVICLLGVIFGAVSQLSAKPSSLVLLGMSCLGAVIFSVAAVKYVLNALRSS